jgi:DNA-binding Lrp family transcriptional regulator
MSPLNSIITPTELFVLPITGRYEMSIVALAYNFENKGLKMSNGDLAKILRTSSRTVERVIARLRKKGIIEDTGTKKNHRCLRLTTDTMSVIHTDTMSVEIPTRGGANTDTTADHNKRKKKNTSSKGTASGFVSLWNTQEKLPKIITMSDTRHKAFRTRMGEKQFAESWRQIIEKIAASDFLCGKNDRGWRADIDWLLKNNTNYVKVLEDKFKNKSKPGELVCHDATDEEANELFTEIKA